MKQGQWSTLNARKKTLLLTTDIGGLCGKGKGAHVGK